MKENTFSQKEYTNSKNERGKKWNKKTKHRQEARDIKDMYLNKNYSSNVSREPILLLTKEREKFKKKKSKILFKSNSTNKFTEKVKSIQIIKGTIQQKLTKTDKNGDNYLVLELDNERTIFVFASKVKEKKWTGLREDKRYSFLVGDTESKQIILGNFEMIKKAKGQELEQELKNRLSQKEIVIIKNNRVIWTNLNYKDEKTDLMKFRPYLVKSVSSSENFFLLELMTITSQNWKADFKYKVKVKPRCFKKETSSFIYLDTSIYIKIEKENLKKMCRCSCANCFTKTEYNSIVYLQEEFQKNNRVKKIEIERETLTAQIQISPKSN